MDEESHNQTECHRVPLKASETLCCCSDGKIMITVVSAVLFVTVVVTREGTRDGILAVVDVSTVVAVVGTTVDLGAIENCRKDGDGMSAHIRAVEGCNSASTNGRRSRTSTGGVLTMVGAFRILPTHGGFLVVVVIAVGHSGPVVDVVIVNRIHPFYRQCSIFEMVMFR